MNAVACEVQVIATGARPSENSSKRELFTEETTTALVFENGGVLRLAAAVVPGQLLFLTQKETKREVVAQVMRKRNFRPLICYVEVEFSEPSPGFWGIEFPEAPALAPASAGQKEADEAGQADEDIIGEEPSAPAAAPSAQEVTALKNEVEALREQLKSLQTQTVARNLSPPAVTPDLSGSTAPEPSHALADVPSEGPVSAAAPTQPSPRLQTTAGEASQKLPTEVSGALASPGVAGPPASTSVSTDRAEPLCSEEDLLPKPALHFEDAKQMAKPSSKAARKIAANSQPSALRKDLLFAAFVLVTAGAAWYQNLLPGLPQPKIFSPNTAPSIAAHPAPHAPAKTANAQPDSAKSPQTSEAPTAAPGAALRDASQPRALETARPSAPAVTETPGAAKSAPNEAADVATVLEKPEIAASARKRSAPPTLSRAAMVSAVPPSDGVAIVPPKLIKSVRAIASPNALQDFATGNGDSVTLDALVDTSGRVKSMKVLSGAASLQRAAMEALKQYTYEAATRRGKPVPAHVTVKVKFLFEP
jgi:TonB family protein